MISKIKTTLYITRYGVNWKSYYILLGWLSRECHTFSKLILTFYVPTKKVFAALPVKWQLAFSPMLLLCSKHAILRSHKTSSNHEVFGHSLILYLHLQYSSIAVEQEPMNIAYHLPSISISKVLIKQVRKNLKIFIDKKSVYDL